MFITTACFSKYRVVGLKKLLDWQSVLSKIGVKDNFDDFITEEIRESFITSCTSFQIHLSIVVGFELC